MWPISATFDVRPDEPNSRMSPGRVRARDRRRDLRRRARHLVRGAAADLLQHALRGGRVEDHRAPDEAGAVEAAVRLADRLVVGAAPDVGHADLAGWRGRGRVALAGGGGQAGELGDDGARVVGGHAVQHPGRRPRGVGAGRDLGVAALQPVGAGRDGCSAGRAGGRRPRCRRRRAGCSASRASWSRADFAVGARPSAGDERRVELGDRDGRVGGRDVDAAHRARHDAPDQHRQRAVVERRASARRWQRSRPAAPRRG